MTSTSIFRVKHLEPPPWLYAWMARGSLFRMIYRRFSADLAALLPTGARVLDVGTGPGYLLAELVKARPDLDLWGLDLAHAMVRRPPAAARGAKPPATSEMAGGRRPGSPFSGPSFRPGRGNFQLSYLAPASHRFGGNVADRQARRPGLDL